MSMENKCRENCPRLAQAQIPTPTDIQKKNKKKNGLMRIGLKISRHGVVTMIFRKPFPIIGLLMEGKIGIAPG